MAITYIIGDIHGGYRALKQVLERSNFDYENDTLISLGDIVDGWSETYECVEELLKIKNLIRIRGNHDQWFNEYLQLGLHPTKWEQGAAATAKSYLRQIGKENLITRRMSGYVCALNPEDVPQTHHDFFKNQINYYIDESNRLFVHGGFNRHQYLKGQPEYIFYWDRDLWSSALSYESMVRGDVNKDVSFKIKDNFSEIFVGHTTTENWGKMTPMKAANIYNLDTGGGWSGKLTIMNVDTHEYFQSDIVKELYPDEKGR